ncbi:putative mitochondrial genome maintenance protein [Limtongia smithiae]|uniref:putative mitochondrial genome maintenance protein n=1 Tax=Limtongia smithiae TaxID=1125753 RepID=UPI0034CD3A1E
MPCIRRLYATVPALASIATGAVVRRIATPIFARGFACTPRTCAQAPPFDLPEPPPYPSSSSPPSSATPVKSPPLLSLNDAPLAPLAAEAGDSGVDNGDWSRSFAGLSEVPFPPEVANVLMAPIDKDDIEMKPDGILYLPEIKYRRILNRAFGPGGWGLAPRSQTIVAPKQVTREYALVCHGRLVSIARGEQDFFDPSGVSQATEGCKSNALMRCCKDLGIASELWDPRFIRQFKKEYCVEQFVEHVTTKKKRKCWRRKDQSFEYPYKVVPFGTS